MFARQWILIAACVTSLTACFPAREISQDNAVDILSVNNRLSQAQRATKDGFSSPQINNQSLERLLVSRISNNTVTGECHNNQGSFLFTRSETDDVFSLVFDQCAGDDGGQLDGALSGEFTSEGDTYSAVLTGDIDASKGNESIAFAPLTLSLGFTLSDTDISFEMSHGGVYDYDTRFYKGKVTVETVEPISFSSTTLSWTGKVNYTDSKGNVLTVEYDNNGVHLSFNSVHFKTYTTGEWLQKFN